MKAIYVTDKTRMPTTDHFAILEFSSIHIPGDQRSKDAPGHGYPEHSEKVVTYRAYMDRAEWEAEIQRLELNKFSRPYSALIVTIPKIAIQVTVK
jgi:hypothetical protein